MKTYNERTKSILDKVSAKKAKKRKATAVILSISCCLVLMLGLFAMQFLPLGTPTTHTPTESNPNEYYPLVTQLRQLAITPPGYKDFIYGADLDSAIPEVDVPVSDPIEGITNSPNGTYEEVTDNQVQGVTESDLIKRSDRYIYYLRFNRLTVYSIDKENSKALGTYDISDTEDLSYKHYSYDREMYLSQDCSTVTIITNCYSKQLNQRCICVINLDVTDPKNIIKCGELLITGSHLSSRVIDGEIYLISNYYVDSKPDYSDPTTFVPQYGAPGNMTTIAMKDIIIPQEAASAMYTVIHKLDQKTLDVNGSTALLSYTGKVFVSNKHIFLTRGHQESQETDECITYDTMTEITQLNFELKQIRTFDVRGTINNQYNLDEKDGILRIVTTTETYVHKTTGNILEDYYSVNANPTNASLYCIDLSDGSIRASVENFAPPGESVQSVRFDGDYAYVCTSIVLSDPVFFFDLSDLDHITYKDTGTIPGYSISLVDFADGFLMGIGYSESFGTLKVEIYQEGATEIESHCKYERNCYFSTDYKSYYIDRENQLIGLGIETYDGNSRYILLHFDGYGLVEVLSANLDGANETKRAVYIDGYLYMFGDSYHAFGDDFAVEKVM